MSDLVPEEAVRAADIWAGAIPHGDLREALETAAPLILAAYLDGLAREADRTERAVRSFGVTDYSEGKADGVNWAAKALRDRASVLRGEGDPK